MCSVQSIGMATEQENGSLDSIFARWEAKPEAQSPGKNKRLRVWRYNSTELICVCMGLPGHLPCALCLGCAKSTVLGEWVRLVGFGGAVVLMVQFRDPVCVFGRVGFLKHGLEKHRCLEYVSGVARLDT